MTVKVVRDSEKVLVKRDGLGFYQEPVAGSPHAALAPGKWHEVEMDRGEFLRRVEAHEDADRARVAQSVVRQQSELDRLDAIGDR